MPFISESLKQGFKSLNQTKNLKEGLQTQITTAAPQTYSDSSYLNNMMQSYITAEQNVATLQKKSDLCSSSGVISTDNHTYINHNDTGCLTSHASDQIDIIIPSTAQDCATRCDNASGCNVFVLVDNNVCKLKKKCDSLTDRGYPGYTGPTKTTYLPTDCSNVSEDLSIATAQAEQYNNNYKQKRDEVFQKYDPVQNNILKQLSIANDYSKVLNSQVSSATNIVNQHTDINAMTDKIKQQNTTISAEYDDSNLIIKSQQLQYLAQFILLITIIAIITSILKGKENRRLVNFIIVLVSLMCIYLISRGIFNRLFR